jgi:hypothetical protein
LGYFVRIEHFILIWNGHDFQLVHPWLDIDKLMDRTSIVGFSEQYVKKLMMRDMLGAIMSFQDSGVIVTNLEVQEHKSLTETSYTISFSLGEIGGAPSTIHLKVQAVQPDGTYMANGTRYQMANQLGEAPIRKISSSVVVLTSYYGKTSIKRNAKVVNDMTAWVGNRICALALDDNIQGITGLKDVTAFDNTFTSPRIYAIIAKRLAAVTVNGMALNFDHKTLITGDIAKIVMPKIQTTHPGAVVCGLEGDNYVFVDIASDQRLVIKVQRHAVYRHSCQTLSDDRVNTR